MKRQSIGSMLSLVILAALAWGVWHVFGKSTDLPPMPGGQGLRNEAAIPMSMGNGLEEPVRPIRAAAPLNRDKVALGKALFHDARLSADNSISCASCHNVNEGGADRRSRSLGIRAQEGEVNSPGVNYASLNFRQFWDGRSPSLEAQVDGPVHHPAEMASNWEQVIGKLLVDAAFARDFKHAYPEGLTATSLRDAIATYERSLSTPSRFDRWLEGDKNALTAEETSGYKLFKHHGCTACHQGVGLGGNMFQRFGIMDNPLERKPQVTRADLGRFNVTGRKDDRFVFKVPSLRNVALTAPYFHDGSAASLEEAVGIMGRAQLGLQLNTAEIALVTAFLRTLNGAPAP